MDVHSWAVFAEDLRYSQRAGIEPKRFDDRPLDLERVDWLCVDPDWAPSGFP
jgi:hypothetical protein